MMSVVSDQAVRIIASKNPFDGVSINLDFLGPAFKGTWQLWLGGAWGLAIIALGFFMSLGKAAVYVDGKRVEPARTVNYKGLMYTGVPNLANTFGYTNASWTLKADLTAGYLCRLLNHMEARGCPIASRRSRSTSSGASTRAMPLAPEPPPRASPTHHSLTRLIPGGRP